MNSNEAIELESEVMDYEQWAPFNASFIFPGLPEVVQNLLYRFALYMDDASLFPIYANRVILTTVVILNFFHVLVLMRKNMKRSSSNVIMFGLAVSDMLIAGVTFTDVVQSFMLSADISLECFAPPSYGNVVFEFIVTIGNDFARRCSPWLAISLAATRALSIAKALDSRYDFLQFAKAGWSAILISMLASGLLSVFHFFTISISVDYTNGDNGLWTPPEHCHNFPANYSTLRYYLVDDNTMMGYYSAINETISKFFPCFAFPFLSYILVKNIIRRNEVKNKVIKNQTIAKKDRTTQLITFTTVCFTISQFPQGFFKFIPWFISTHQGFLMISYGLSYHWNTVEYLNAATHPVVCFFMQAQYRTEIKKILKIKRNVVHVEN